MRLAALLAIACALPLQVAARPEGGHEGGHGGGEAAGQRGPGGGGRGGSMTGVANPSAVIDAEIAFARLAQAKGQWTAFRDTAATDAVMFVPGKVNARDWLKGKENPPVALKWQAHEVWMSCDGSYAVSRGAYQGPRDKGVFTTVWQRQPASGSYKWVLDLGEPEANPPEAPDMIPAHVADCSNRPRHLPRPKKPPKVPATIDPADAQSDDGTLRWTATLDANRAGTFVASRWDGTGYQEAERLTLSPQR